MHAYDSVIVIDKARRSARLSEVSGSSDYIHINRIAGATNVELLATREEVSGEPSTQRPRRPCRRGRGERAADAEARTAKVFAEASAAAETTRDELRLLRAELIAANQHGAELIRAGGDP